MKYLSVDLKSGQVISVEFFPTWQANTHYNTTDWIFINNVGLFYCNEEHTSSTNFENDSSLWTNILNSFSNIKVDTTIMSATKKEDTIELIGTNNLSITPNISENKIIFDVPKSKLVSTINRVSVETETNTINIGLQFNLLTDSLDVYQIIDSSNKLYLELNIDYSLSEDNTQIIKTSGNWTQGTIITFKLLTIQ